MCSPAFTCHEHNNLPLTYARDTETEEEEGEVPPAGLAAEETVEVLDICVHRLDQQRLT